LPLSTVPLERELGRFRMPTLWKQVMNINFFNGDVYYTYQRILVDQTQFMHHQA
jgi:hypothetical protein